MGESYDTSPEAPSLRNYRISLLGSEYYDSEIKDTDLISFLVSSKVEFTPTLLLPLYSYFSFPSLNTSMTKSPRAKQEFKIIPHVSVLSSFLSIEKMECTLINNTKFGIRDANVVE